MRYALIALGVFLGVGGVGRAAFEPDSDLAPFLTPKDTKTVEETLAATMKDDMGAAERRYQEAVQKQTFRDLLAIYDPSNEARLEIAYANFTPDWNQGEFAPPGKDLGYGLHVIKKLETQVAGKTKIIYVNEQWPADRRTGGLFLPDAIRMRTRVVDGTRFVEGSHLDFLFDSFRVSWSNGNAEAKIHRQVRYGWNDQKGKNERHTLRIPVAPPVSCNTCHKPTTSFAKEFLQAGETRNYETIVQDGFFRLPFEKQSGFQQYVAHVKELGRKTDVIEKDLKNAKVSMRVPRLREALLSSLGSYDWIGEDSGLHMPEGLSQYWYRQGVYVSREGYFLLDAIEDVFEGKYRYWEPTTVVPSR